MNEDKFLGKKVEYSGLYDPSLIVPVPRQENRTLIDIENSNLPFVGYDVWNAYEISCLTKNGRPFVGIAKIVYPCNSEFIVESKSLKLYLNSFNMTRTGTTSTEATAEVLAETIARDLTSALKARVSVKVFDASNSPNFNLLISAGGWNSIEKYIDDEITCDVYNEDKTLLLPTKEYEILVEKSYSSRCLRSNCKVTKQPDWGDVYIHYCSYKEIDPNNLYRYLVSFRNEAHFHEEICETIFKRLYDTLQPVSLVVACFYTRRGGIDINPIRSMLPADLKYFEDYLKHTNISSKTLRQ